LVGRASGLKIIEGGVAVATARARVAAAADALSPIRQTLHHMAARADIPPLQGIAPGLVVTDPTGWVRATDVVSGAALDDLLGAAAARWQAPPHAAAALAFKYYAYWLALPAVLGYATARRVPLMGPDAVLVRWSPDPADGTFLQVGLRARRAGLAVAMLPTDPLLPPGPRRGIRVVPHEAALLDELRTALMDEHLTPVLGHIRRRTHLGRRSLWGSLASGVAHGLSRAADVIPGPTAAVVDRVLASLRIGDLVEIAQRDGSAELSVQRRTCCLAFTLPEPHRRVCSGCCITH
jgi:hypothetical protein